ncbi:hypothetical protein LCGC14_2866650 [marine sediment metagenome]|uniref:Homing endonuclease LAGLIDADG domain-containing protein n=1 Tax=marine sediment metagenome TaxID=412755 RepID=A0A0F8Y4C6_9ZZZZ
MITRENIIWLAGLLEGEGCFSNRVGKHRRIMICVAMTDKDVIADIADLTQVSIHGPYRRNTRYKVQWGVSLHGGKAAGFMMMVYPFMHARRKQQINHVLGEWKQQGICYKDKTHCKNGHPLQPFTRPSKKRMKRWCPICVDAADRKRRPTRFATREERSAWRSDFMKGNWMGKKRASIGLTGPSGLVVGP